MSVVENQVILADIKEAYFLKNIKALKFAKYFMNFNLI